MYLQSFEELPDILPVSLDEETDHATETFYLCQRQLVAGMRGKAQVDHLCHIRRGFQKLSSSHGIALVFSHANVQSLEATVCHVAVERPRNAART